MGTKFKSDFLVASGSMASGAARLWDWGGTFDQYNISRTTQEADLNAMASDWSIVGDDIQDAILEFDALHPVK